MKTFVPTLVAISSVAVLVAAGGNTTTDNEALPVATSGNTTTDNEALRVTPPHEAEISGTFRCTVPFEGLFTWYYNSRGEGPYKCTFEHDTFAWGMLNAYRSGGTQGVHWKYTDDVMDPECLFKWKYYSDDGQTLVATISARTTMLNDSRRWCALPVYRKGGVRGKQWEYCSCVPVRE